jgi:hypothetical protein
MSIAHPSRFADGNGLTDGPIAPHIDAFKQHLADGRYASSTVAKYLSPHRPNRYASTRSRQSCGIAAFVAI